MDLWIRSQSKKKLIKVNKVWIEDEEIYAYSYTEYDERIGIYKNEKRALEVLDEIMNILKPKKILKTVDDSVQIDDLVYRVNPTYETIMPSNVYVYEMPQE